ncbi:PAP2 superfamily protein [compost metagenome]
MAGFACYVTLPWLLSRPPRLITGTGSAPQMAAINALVLGRVSHQLNTFPSGHVAVALAASGVLWPVSPAASAAVGCAAAAIAAAAAAGRYHYVTDVWAGGLVGLVAVTLARAAA